MTTRLVAIALTAAVGSAAGQVNQGRAPDLAPPQIYIANLPTLASSYATKFTATYTDNVELAYVRTGAAASSIYSQPFVFMPEGMKYYQLEDTLIVPLGETVTRTLMAVDTSGNVAKKTVTVVGPDVPFKEGTYTVAGGQKIPSGFSCLPAWVGPPIDGLSVTGLSVRPMEMQWSVADGFRPTVFVIAQFGFGLTPSTNISLNATSFTSVQQTGSGSGPGYSYEAKYLGVAQVIQNAPRTIQVSFTMSCNVNGSGWVNGTTANFTGQLPL